MCRLGCAVPGDRALEAFAQGGRGPPVEEPLGAAVLAAAAGLAVGHQGVPDDLALQAVQVGYRAGELERVRAHDQVREPVAPRVGPRLAPIPPSSAAGWKETSV